MKAAVRLLMLLALCAALLPATTYYVTVAGLGGEQDYEVRFAAWAVEIEKLVRAGGDVKTNILTGPAATKAKLQEALAGIAKEASATDTLVVMLIGHGSFDGNDYKMNLPGPDITATELTTALDRVPTARQLVVNMTSASGASTASLRKPNRAVITATKSGTERNATVFPRYWVEAMRDAAADADKNEVISALEAFRFAEQRTVRFYEQQKRLATEHALLEDTGQGEGVRAPSAENGEGLLAGRFPLLRLGAAQLAAQDPEKQKLLARKEEIETQIDTLKYQKAAMNMAEYKQQLQTLLLALARTQAELDK